MSTVVDSLLIRLGVDPSGVAKGMDEAQSSISTGVRGILSQVVAPLAGIFAVGGLVSGYLEQADAVGKLSDSLGEAVEDMQAWSEAVERAGGNADAFHDNLKDLNEKLVETAATGEGEGAEIFKALGISAKDAAGNVRSSLDVMGDLAAKAETMGKAEFAGWAQRLGFDHGTIMLLQSGRKAVEELVARQKELGVYTKRDTEVAAAANDALADLGQSFKAGAAIILRIVVPAITWLSGKITSVIVFLRQHEPFVLAMLGGIATVLTARLIPASLRFAAVWLANPLTWIIMGIAAAALALGLIIDDLFAYMSGGKSALADFWAIFGTGEEIAQALGDAWEDLKVIGTRAFEALKGAVGFFFSAFSSAFSGLGGIVKGVLRTIKGLFTADFALIVEGIGDVFSGVGTLIAGVFAGVVDTVKALWGALWDWVLGLLGTSTAQIRDGIIAAFRGAIDTVKGLFKAMMDTVLGWIQSLLDMIPTADGIKKTVGGAADWVSEQADAAKSTASGAYAWAKSALGFGDEEAPVVTPTAADVAQTAAVQTQGAKTDVRNSSTTNVGTINVQTQATDAPGIAGAIGGELAATQDRYLVQAAQTGTVQK